MQLVLQIGRRFGMHNCSGNLAISASDVPNTNASSFMRTVPTAPAAPFTPPTSSHLCRRRFCCCSSAVSPSMTSVPYPSPTLSFGAQILTVASPPPVANTPEGDKPCTAHTPCLMTRVELERFNAKLRRFYDATLAPDNRLDPTFLRSSYKHSSFTLTRTYVLPVPPDTPILPNRSRHRRAPIP